MKTLILGLLILFNISDIYAFKPNLFNNNLIKLRNIKKYKNNIIKYYNNTIDINNNNFLPNYAKIILLNYDLKYAELKHGRIATLATIGRIFSETLHPQLSLMYYSDNLLVNNELAPSLLNGGLEKINIKFYLIISFFIFIIETISLIDLISFKKDKNDNFKIVFDPLNIYINKSDIEKKKLKKYELNISRYCMLLSTWFAYYEYNTHTPIINYEISSLFPWIIGFIYIQIFT